MVRDPVCSALVDESASIFMLRLEDETHYFCSKACLEKFELREKLFCDLNSKGWVKRRVERFLREGGGGGGGRA